MDTIIFNKNEHATVTFTGLRTVYDGLLAELRKELSTELTVDESNGKSILTIGAKNLIKIVNAALQRRKDNAGNLVVNQASIDYVCENVGYTVDGSGCKVVNATFEIKGPKCELRGLESKETLLVDRSEYSLIGPNKSGLGLLEKIGLYLHNNNTGYSLSCKVTH